MPVFHVYLNGKKITTAGIDEPGVFSTILNWARRPRPATKARSRGPALMEENLNLHVGGLISPEYLDWVNTELKIGDEVRIRIAAKAKSPITPPTRRPLDDEATRMGAQKRYVRKMAKQWGWEIKIPTRSRNKNLKG